MPIPKIIIQTWKSKDLPDYYKKTQENIIRIHPDYEYKYFDDEGIDVFINTNYPQLKSTVKKFKRKIQLIDFFRLLAVHKYGGFYFDMDVEVVKKLDDLLSYECVFPAEMLRNSQILKNMGYDYNLGNYAFGASKNNNVIWNIITSIVNVMENPNLMSTDLKDISDSVLSDFNNHNNHNNSNNSDSNTKHNEHLMQEYVYHTTGPVMVSKSVFESMGSNMSVKILYPKDWPSRSSWFFFGDYAQHTMTGTWKENDTSNNNNNSNNTNNSNNNNNNQNNKDISEKKDNIEKFTANDIYEDPSSYLIICTVIMIIVVLFILISIAFIGCDKDIKIIRL